MKKILLVLLMVAYMFAGCVEQKHSKAEIHKYKTEGAVDGQNEILYWYLMFYNNTYYYYSSPVPITDYSTINWSTSATSPSELFGATDLGVDMVSSESLSADVADAVDAGTDANADSGTDSNADTGADSNSDAGTDAGADAGGDTGGDAGGGGDSGGGDSGGGGE